MKNLKQAMTIIAVIAMTIMPDYSWAEEIINITDIPDMVFEEPISLTETSELTVEGYIGDYSETRLVYSSEIEQLASLTLTEEEVLNAIYSLMSSEEDILKTTAIYLAGMLRSAESQRIILDALSDNSSIARDEANFFVNKSLVSKSSLTSF